MTNKKLRKLDLIRDYMSGMLLIGGGIFVAIFTSGSERYVATAIVILGLLLLVFAKKINALLWHGKRKKR